MKIHTLCFDIDNTICKTSGNNYSISKPIKKNIKVINALHKKGHKIIIFTARHMTTTNGKIKEVYDMGYKKTYNQLTKWGLKFDELIMGKPSYDLFVDDKNMGFTKNWSEKIKKKYL